MTLFAGIYANDPADAVPDTLCAAAKRALSRHPNETVKDFRDQRCYLAKVDIGAFGSEGVLQNSLGISFMAGEPLLERGARAYPRSADLSELHAALSSGSFDVLSHTRGVFAIAHYRPQSGKLVLVTDKLGIRPVFFSVGERYTVFATALRILEQIPGIPKAMDVRAITEENSLGYALSDRTPFAAIALLRPAEILQVTDRAASRQRYWRWDRIRTAHRPVDELARDAYNRFSDGVALRNGSDSSTLAFLSGGLDSRAIVAALRQRGVRVHTFNFSPTGSQDQVFGAAFGKCIGTMHTERPIQPSQPMLSIAGMTVEAWNSSPWRLSSPAERPGIIWSGDGGSVTLGHVYLNSAMVEAARRGDVERAMSLSDHGWGNEIPRRILNSQLLDSLSGNRPRDGLKEELSELECDDIGRALHLVLMHNDQHRHLSQHFEEIDVRRREYQLPFFDSAFVESVLKVPIDLCLGHRFYMHWLRCFPEMVLSVPWQAYPGHEPCPLPIPSGVTYQWGESVAARRRSEERKTVLRKGVEMVRARSFPSPLLRRTQLRVATLAHWLKLRDVGYAIRAAARYYDYWQKCGGDYVLPA